MKKRRSQQRQKKLLSASGLIREIRKVFEKIPLYRTSTRGRDKSISLVDSLMSAFAMFSLKTPSLLAFDQVCRKDVISHNLKNLYGINKAPSDTYMREELDEVNPANIRKCFLSVFKAAQRGKLLDKYRFIDGYLLLTDGTGMFNSEKISCENCCEKHHRDGRTTYYHQVLVGAIAHPDQRQVIPLCPELITKQDGTKKNDCERRATQRFLNLLKKEHPRLKATIVSDALSANTPQINEIKSLGYHFIINVKPKGNKTLFKLIIGIDLLTKHIIVGKNQYMFRYINGVPLNDAKDAPLVNFLECTATEVKGKKETKKHFTWVTDHNITEDNIYIIMQGGRARWKIENETFNTLKNQGYRFEHNFGHGHKHLTTIFSYLMLLAFLIDQVQEAACGLFQAALQKSISRRALWEAIRSYFNVYLINSWKDLFVAVGEEITLKLSTNTS